MSKPTQSLSFTMKEHRLNQPDMFRALYRKGLRQKVGGLFVMVLPKEDALRLGMVIRKKTAKQAVARNRMRRVIREWVRVHQHELPKVWLVVDCQKNYAPSEHDLLRLHLEEALAKAFESLRQEGTLSS